MSGLWKAYQLRHRMSAEMRRAQNPKTARSRQTMLYDRLSWAHGSDRADQIMSGKDAATNADIRAWNNLGSGRNAANLVD